MPRTIELSVNGARVTVDAEGDTSLLQVLREQLQLTGAKYGCGEGRCGACAVLVDGEPVRSCLKPLQAVAGKQILTVEGLAKEGVLHPLQQAFLDVEALQCGYCTPGMVMEGVALLQANARPERDEIVRAMEGHICRCGTYPRIVAAIERAATGAAGSRPRTPETTASGGAQGVRR